MICFDVGGGGDDDWWPNEIGLGCPRDVGCDVRMSLVMMHQRRMLASFRAWHDLFPCMSQSMGDKVQRIELSLAVVSRKCLLGGPLP